MSSKSDPPGEDPSPPAPAIDLVAEPQHRLDGDDALAAAFAG